MKKVKYIIIVLVILIVIGLLYIFMGKKSEADILNDEKNQEIDKMFNTWTNIAMTGDKQYLKTNEIAIKQDIFTKLNIDETKSLSAYSDALNNMISSKDKPLSALFLVSAAYLTANFNNVKQIVNKTSIKDVFNKFGFSNLQGLKTGS
jgi:regulatory protein YycI of two-component signal transduction system YycFG